MHRDIPGSACVVCVLWPTYAPSCLSLLLRTLTCSWSSPGLGPSHACRPDHGTAVDNVRLLRVGNDQLSMTEQRLTLFRTCMRASVVHCACGSPATMVRMSSRKAHGPAAGIHRNAYILAEQFLQAYCRMDPGCPTQRSQGS